MNVLAIFLLAFLVVLFSIAAMAVGVMRGRAPIRGSCGGLNGKPCALCSGTCTKESAK